MGPWQNFLSAREYKKGGENNIQLTRQVCSRQRENAANSPQHHNRAATKQLPESAKFQGKTRKKKPTETEQPHRRGACPVNNFTTVSWTLHSWWSVPELLSLAMWIQQHSFYRDYLQLFQRTEEKPLSFTYPFLLYVLTSLLFFLLLPSPSDNAETSLC